MRHLAPALALLTLACSSQAAPLGCDQATVRYSPPRQMPLAGHVSVKRLATRPAEPAEGEEGGEDKPWAPQGTAAFRRITEAGINGPRTQALDVFANRAQRAAWRIAFTVETDSVEAQWLNEELLFVRAWWGRIISTDLIFEVSSGRFLYVQEANYGLLTQPCEEAQPK